MLYDAQREVNGVIAVYANRPPYTLVNTAPENALAIGSLVNILYVYTVIFNWGLRLEENRLVTLLDRVRETIRYKHYSLRTEQAYVEWIRRFVLYHKRRHPREMGAHEVRAFLGYLASDLKVAAATHQQALSALLFLYREVLGITLPWLDDLHACDESWRARCDQPG